MSVDGIGSATSQFQMNQASDLGMRRKPDDEEMAAKLSEDMMSALDADGDGSLSVSETALSDEDFAGVDSDGDGLVSGEELTSGLKGRNDALKVQVETFMQEQGMEMPQFQNTESAAAAYESLSLDGLLSGDDESSAFSALYSATTEEMSSVSSYLAGLDLTV